MIEASPVGIGGDIVTPYRPVGSKANTAATRRKEMTEASISGIGCYNDLVYLFSSILEQATITTPSGATNARRWTYTPANFAPDTVVPFTVEKGSSAGAERFGFGTLDSLDLTFNPTEVTIGGSMFGQELTEGIALTGSPTTIAEQPIDPHSVSIYVGTAFTNEVQTVTIGTHTGGTFTLTVVGPEGDSATTAAIAFNAAAAAVTSALEALSNVAPGDVLVVGAASPWTVTFQGRLAALNMATMTMTSSLTGGSGQGVSQTTAGGLTKLTRCHSLTLGISERFMPGPTLDAEEDSYSYIVEGPVGLTGQLILQHDSTSVAYMTSLRDKTTLFLRVISHGPLIEAGFPHRLQITTAFKFRTSGRGDQEGVHAATYDIDIVYSDSLAGGSWWEAIVDNGLASL